MARIISKETSRLRLAADGRWYQDGRAATHAGIAEFFHQQIRTDADGEPYLYNAIIAPDGRKLEEHVYFEVEDAMRFVDGIQLDDGDMVARLVTGERETIDPESLKMSREGRVYCRLSDGSEACFRRHATAQLEPMLVEQNERPALKIGDDVVPLQPR